MNLPSVRKKFVEFPTTFNVHHHHPCRFRVVLVGELGPPLPPNRMTPFPLSPALSKINVVPSKSNVPAFYVLSSYSSKKV